MIQQYLQAALAQARFKTIENPEPIFGEIAQCPGVWATGETEEECRQTLEEALEDWVLLGIRLGHSLPEISGVRIETDQLVRWRIKLPLIHAQEKGRLNLANAEIDDLLFE